MLIDTGPLVAAALTGDRHHRESIDLFTAANLAGEPLLVPAPVVSEVGYLIEREAGPRAEAAFAQSLAEEQFEVIDLLPTDWSRVAELPANVRRPPARHRGRLRGCRCRAPEDRRDRHTGSPTLHDCQAESHRCVRTPAGLTGCESCPMRPAPVVTLTTSASRVTSPV
ncbi:type II toxin-antitoxin system VapC family toxin [Nostocoides sp.]